MSAGDVETYFQDGRWRNRIEGDNEPLGGPHDTLDEAAAVGAETAATRRVEHSIHRGDHAAGTRGARSDDNAHSTPLRTRVREAGGWYSYINRRLIKLAGPAAVGPYETTAPPSDEERAERACPLCGQPIRKHTFDRSGERTQMYCP